VERVFAAGFGDEKTSRYGDRSLSGKRAGRSAEVIRLPTIPRSSRGNAIVAVGDRKGFALAGALERRIISRPAAAIGLAALGALLGLLSRKYLPTQSIFDLM
jgi:hypothetical protein